MVATIYLILLMTTHQRGGLVEYHILSSPGHKVLMVSYCDRPLSVVVRHWILTKLHRNDPWVVPY